MRVAEDPSNIMDCDCYVVQGILVVLLIQTDHTKGFDN